MLFFRISGIFLKTLLKRLFFVLIDARIPGVIHGFFCRRFSFLVKTVNGACLSNTELNVEVKFETPWRMFHLFKSVILIDKMPSLNQKDNLQL